MNTKIGVGKFSYAQLKIGNMTDILIAVKQAEFNLKPWFLYSYRYGIAKYLDVLIVENALENTSELAINLQHVNWF